MNQTGESVHHTYPFLQGGGEMGALIREMNWLNTPLGEPYGWSAALRQNINMMLTTNFPMLICWGDEYIQLYNDAFRPILGESKHPQAMGGSAKMTYAEIWDTIGPMFAGVMAGTPVGFPDFMVVLNRYGYAEDCYFDFSYSPIQDDDGTIIGVRVICVETTEKVRALENLEVQQQNIRNMVLQAPVGMCIVQGELLRVEEVNDLFLELIGKTRRQTLLAPYWEVIPEAAGFYEPITRHVMETGETYKGKEHKVTLNRNGKEEVVYIDFVYEPMKNAEGKVDAIMIVAIEVTEKIIARDEMQHVNENLAAINEELTVTNEALRGAQEKLENLVTGLAESDARFRSLVQQAPVAIFILRGREQRIEAMNDRMFRMLGKNAAIIGKTYREALPEFADQPFFQLIDEVFTSGKPYYGNELPAKTEYDGEIKEGYYNLIYEPIKDEQGITNSVMCVSIDVTEQVNARKRVERAEQNLRMAVDAAELGSYRINTEDRIFVASPRLKEFFGFGPDEDVPYEAAINQIHEDYRQQAADQMEAAITKGLRFDMEYPVVGHNNGKIRWVRGIGTLQHDADGKSYFTGVLHDISEKKQDEIRKNDFIGMVSHELKTPLTSLSAYLQVLQQKAQKDKDSFSLKALDQSVKQTKKMTAMINGFLNVSRLESGKIHIEKERFDMAGLMKETEAETQAMTTSHTFIFAPVEETFVLADREKIGHVISNFLSNAVKYSKPGSTINIACVTADGDAIVSVKDQGIGIEPKDLNQLFARYYRVVNTSLVSGFGIGLYLSAEIINRHNGRIWAESTPGKGSTFYFSLPVVS
ncbi:MAG: hypothetical protein NVSMB24_35410 [Mucilaginibacter sp.]